MNTYSNSQLEGMGLTPHRTNVDEIIRFSNWPRKVTLHAAIRAQNVPGRPEVDDIWRIAQGTALMSVTRCNMGICIIRITAVVPGGMPNGTDKDLPAEYYLCKEEMGVWTMKYLTSAEGSHKNNAHLRQASDLNNYSISKYNEFVPPML